MYDFNVLPNLATFTFNNKSFANLPVQSLHIPQRGNTDLAIIVYLGYRSISRLCCAAGGKNIIYDQDAVFLYDENIGDYVMIAVFGSYVKSRPFNAVFCRPADPEAKGKVENCVKYVKQNFLHLKIYIKNMV